MARIPIELCIAAIVVVSFVVIDLFTTYVFPPIAEYLDSRRFEAFDAKCKQAHESIYARLKADEFAIEYFPRGGIQNETYEANSVVFQLMKPPQVVNQVQMFYEDNESANNDCRGAFVNVITDFNSIAHPKAGLCKNQIDASSVTRARVLVSLQRGTLEHDIRPIRFQVIDTKSNQILAQQSTFELLLGEMRSFKYRRWYGWGSAQGAISCKLSSPRELIGKVIGTDSAKDAPVVSLTSNPAIHRTAFGAR